MMMAKLNPEQEAREQIDAQLQAAGWHVQSKEDTNLAAGQGVAVREVKTAEGFADYVLFVDGRAVGILEAKKVGYPLTGVEIQAQTYSETLPQGIDAPIRPLPFVYLSTGAETRFVNLIDPEPRSRRVFHFHRPETLAEWLCAETLDQWVKSLQGQGGLFTAADDTKPSTLRSRLQTMPAVHIPNLWPNKIEALSNLEHSLKADKPRALIQMATGSGKTKLAVTAIYRLVQFAGARRVLFLVDRGNLGEQAEKEFQSYWTPDDNRKFTELYKVQRLSSNTVASSSKVVITTIQRLYAALKGEPDFDPEEEERSPYDAEPALPKEPLPVVYNAAIPPEYFDIVFIDECHRSIYSLWRQVLEYFDAHLVGLTATPAKHTFGFFNQNLVMEYPHEQAVADGCNVDFEVYTIRTKITEQGSTIEAGNQTGIRDRQTRKVRWEEADEDIAYQGSALDRDVVARDQIRLVVKTFQGKLGEIFPGRKEVPKTLVFAKDDSHAEDIVDIFREEFGRGNDFCQKITYRTTGAKPADLIQDFRNSFNPRVAVTVDMIATGTDIKPVECVMFMRTVKSRVLFEQMKGRGVRVIDKDELKAVTPDAEAKTHFVMIDCVGIADTKLADTSPLERKRHVPLKALLDHVALGGADPDSLSSLASRLTRLAKECEPDDLKLLHEAAPNTSIDHVAKALIAALDPDRQIAQARASSNLPQGAEPSPEQVAAARKQMLKDAAAPLAQNPKLRTAILEVRQRHDQLIDEVSKDELTFAGHSQDAKDKAKALVVSFEKFLADNKAEIDALQFFYSMPYHERLRFKDIKALHEAIKAPPRQWTPERLWKAYETVAGSKVRGAGGERRLTDIVSLVRFALHQEGELVPFAEHVRQRFDNWLAQQENTGRRFSDEQQRWLTMIRDHIAASLEIEVEDLEYTPFVEAGGLGRAAQVFGKDLKPMIEELNKVLAA